MNYWRRCGGVPAGTLGMLAALALSGSMAGAADKNSDGWRPAKGMSGKEGSDVVKVRTVGSGAAAVGAGGGQVIELEYSMPALKVGAEGRQLELGNAPPVGDPGKPVLPVVPCYVILPRGEKLDGVEVLCGKETKLPGRHTIRHGEKAVPLIKGAKAEATAPDPSVYESDDPWPREKHEMVTVQKRRGVSILVVNLNPVVYRPKSGEVSWFGDMTLRVKTSAAAEPEDEVKYRPDPIRPVSEQVDNPETLRTYEAAPANRTAKP